MANMNHRWDATASKTRTAAQLEADGTLAFRTAAGQKGKLKPYPEHRVSGKACAPKELVQVAFNAMNAQADAVAKASDDVNLSHQGRNQSSALASATQQLCAGRCGKRSRPNRLLSANAHAAFPGLSTPSPGFSKQRSQHAPVRRAPLLRTTRS